MVQLKMIAMLKVQMIVIIRTNAHGYQIYLFLRCKGRKMCVITFIIGPKMLKECADSELYFFEDP